MFARPDSVEWFLLWLPVAAPAVGLLGILAARMAERCAAARACRRVSYVCLAAVAVVTLLSVLAGGMAWLIPAATMMALVLGSTLDMRVPVTTATERSL